MSSSGGWRRLRLAGQLREVHGHARDVVEEDDPVRREALAEVRRLVVRTDPPQERPATEQGDRRLDRGVDVRSGLTAERRPGDLVRVGRVDVARVGEERRRVDDPLAGEPATADGRSPEVVDDRLAQAGRRTGPSGVAPAVAIPNVMRGWSLGEERSELGQALERLARRTAPSRRSGCGGSRARRSGGARRRSSAAGRRSRDVVVCERVAVGRGVAPRAPRRASAGRRG